LDYADVVFHYSSQRIFYDSKGRSCLKANLWPDKLEKRVLFTQKEHLPLSILASIHAAANLKLELLKRGAKEMKPLNMFVLTVLFVLIAFFTAIEFM